MRLVQVGFSHKTAPAPARESLARLEPRALSAAWREAGWPEGVLLSTCNRFELYLCRSDASGSAAEVVRILERLAGCALGEWAAVRAGEAAVAHLFEVSAGLDSLVVGETEILGQVKNAYEAALASGSTAKRLNVLFQRALFVGKRVRSDTAIAAGQTSVASVAVQLAEAIFGDLAESSVLVVGAGLVAEQACRHFLSRKVRGLRIVNRSPERAEALAAGLRCVKTPVQVSPWDGLPAALAEADVVLSSTGAGQPVLTRELAAGAALARAGRPLFLIDVAMPRDVEESVCGLDGVFLYRLEDLERIVQDNIRGRQAEIAKARAFAAEKAAQFWAWAQSLSQGRETSLTHSG